MENVAGEQGLLFLLLRQPFPYESSYSLKTSECHKISFFNDEGRKLDHFDIFGMPFPFLALVKL